MFLKIVICLKIFKNRSKVTFLTQTDIENVIFMKKPSRLVPEKPIFDPRWPILWLFCDSYDFCHKIVNTVMPKLSYDNVTMLDNMTRQCHTVMSPRGPVYVASSSCSGSLPFSHERSPDTRCRWVLMIFLRIGPSQLSSCIQCMCTLCGSSWCSHSLDIHCKYHEFRASCGPNPCRSVFHKLRPHMASGCLH